MKKYLISVCVLAAMVVSFFVGGATTPKPNTGSVAVGYDYRYSTTTSTHASASVPRVVKSSAGTLASIVVVSTSTTGAVRIYDSAAATSSDTLIATLGGGIAPGDYMFDVEMRKGIVLDVPVGFNGSYVVTYR